MSAATNQLAHLVRVRDGCFLVYADTGLGEIEVTDIPSNAAHLAYSHADQLTQRLRRRGHRQAVVTNHLGSPITASDLVAAMRAERAERIEADNRLPETQRDLDRIPVSEQKRRMKMDAAFKTRVREIEGD